MLLMEHFLLKIKGYFFDFLKDKMNVISYMYKYNQNNTLEFGELLLSFKNVEDYRNVMAYIEKYYPEIINTPNLYKRLAIYDLIYEFSHFVKFLDYYDELKDAVMSAAKRII